MLNPSFNAVKCLAFSTSMSLVLALTACGGQSSYDSDSDGFDSAHDGDCNDLDAAIYPGAQEVCADGIDQDCSGKDLIDCDGDGIERPVDCDDANSAIFPGQHEIAYDGIDQDCSGADRNDVDGDGQPAVYAVGVKGTDCNDADASIFAGADEIAYDGIDQDCNGRDLLDADGDGEDSVDYGGTDCNDGSDQVFPGADEIAYDGIDQDCSGEDLRDVDGDGVESSKVGGADCDDSLASVHPGAAEIAYDDVDQDCSGKDLVDVDLDGSDYPADCNDSDDAIRPGAAELACDAIDQDCDGLKRDEDCDGFSVPALGEGDCNDLDAGVHPGALDLRNDRDDNCDGVSDEVLSLDEPTALITGEAEQLVGSNMTSADLDGDGFRDLIVGAKDWKETDGEARGAVHILRGTADGIPSLDMAEAAGQALIIRGIGEGDLFGSSVATGDLDGDQVMDLVVGAPGVSAANGRTGAVYVFYGATTPWARNPRADEASVFLTGTQSGEGFGTLVSLVGDVDGRGAQDLLITAPGATINNLSNAGRAWLFTGESLWLAQSTQDAAFVASGAWPNARLGTSATGIGDLNGDGLADIALGAPGADGADGRVSVYFGGSDLSRWSGTTPDLELRSEAPQDAQGALGTVVTALGDVNGDGLADMGVSAPQAVGQAGRVFILFGAARMWESKVDLAIGSGAYFQGDAAGDGLGTTIGSGLVDEDDLSDFFMGTSGSDNGKVYLFLGTPGARWDVLPVTSAAAIWEGSSSAPLGQHLLVDDLDGDAISDLVLAGTVTVEDEAQDALFVFHWR